MCCVLCVLLCCACCCVSSRRPTTPTRRTITYSYDPSYCCWDSASSSPSFTGARNRFKWPPSIMLQCDTHCTLVISPDTTVSKYIQHHTQRRAASHLQQNMLVNRRFGGGSKLDKVCQTLHRQAAGYCQRHWLLLLACLLVDVHTNRRVNCWSLAQ
jgi:hypothetical protein